MTLCGNVEGATVLEIGGGIGALQLELLDAGAAGATNVELSGGYEEAAAELFANREGVERVVADFVDADVPPHDIVVLHRVVCCYPDVDALVGAAARSARRELVLTYPQERRWIGWGLRAVNVWLGLRGCGFRTYHHRFARIADAAEGMRLQQRLARGLFWESAAFER